MVIVSEKNNLFKKKNLQFSRTVLFKLLPHFLVYPRGGVTSLCLSYNGGNFESVHYGTTMTHWTSPLRAFCCNFVVGEATLFVFVPFFLPPSNQNGSRLPSVPFKLSFCSKCGPNKPGEQARERPRVRHAAYWKERSTDRHTARRSLWNAKLTPPLTMEKASRSWPVCD